MTLSFTTSRRITATPSRSWFRTGFRTCHGLQVPVNEGYGKTHDVKVISLDAVDELARQALNRVGAGFVGWFATGDVCADLALAQYGEADASARRVHNHAIALKQADSRDHLVFAPGEQRQHAGCIGSVLRFFQDLPAGHDHRVGAEHDFT